MSTALGTALYSAGVRFVDLNPDALSWIPLKTTLSGLIHLWPSQTVLAADIVVSMPKVKTHHGAGATLSLKNLFGVIPGVKLGGQKTFCIGTESIEASSISRQRFRSTSSSPMESWRWRETGHCLAIRES